MRARQKQKLHAKAGRPCEALRVRSANFFEYIFDDILITQTVKLMELIKMMVKMMEMMEMMKMMEMSRQVNKLRNLVNLINLNPESFINYLNCLIRAGNEKI